MLRIKICGITRPEDALFAQEVGVWAIGFIFAKGTPRFIMPEKARDIADKVSDKTEKIGVFVNSSLKEVTEVSRTADISIIQLHGEEPPEFCREISELTGKKVIKAVKIRNENDLEQINSYKNSASYILLDTYSEKLPGGTGKTFDWEIAKKAGNYGLPIILAGGLNPDNIKSAYEKVRPFALDLSSGVEKSKGIKDPDKIARLKTILNT